MVIGVVTSVVGLVDRAGMRLATLALFAFGLTSATGIAADPTTHQYGSSLEQVSAAGSGGGPGGGGASVGSESVTGGLPFTGLDLVLLAAVAAALVVAGLLLRRRRADSVEG
jgi:hypothetical protein